MYLAKMASAALLGGKKVPGSDKVAWMVSRWQAKYKLVLLVLLLVLSNPISPQTVNLADKSYFLRQGFSEEWATLPLNLKEWREIKPDSTRKHRMRVRDLQIPEFARSSIFMPSARNEHFTFRTQFEMQKKDLDHLQGLKLAHVGLNWEVFVNGFSIRKEIYSNPDGTFRNYRSLYDVIIPIDPRYLVEGENSLTFHIIGDPNDNGTGFVLQEPYVIAPLKDLLSDFGYLIDILTLMIFLLVGFTHFVLYLRRTVETTNLLLSAISLLFSVFFSTQTQFMTDFFFNTDVTYRMTLFCQVLAPCLIGIFYDYVFKGGTTQFTRYFLVGTVPFLVGMIFFERYIARDLNSIWRYLIFVPIVFYLRAMVVGFWQELRERVDNRGYLVAAYNTARHSSPGITAVAGTIFMTAAIADLIVSILYGQPSTYLRWGYVAFVGALAWMLTNRYLEFNRKVETLNSILSHKIYDLKLSNEKLADSEEKYRILVEGSADLIFSLDHDFRFLSGNKAMLRFLGIESEELSRYGLLDILYHGTENADLTMEYWKERLETLRTKGNLLSMKCSFRSFYSPEPVEMSLRIEHADLRGRIEFIGKAQSIIEDSLLKYLQSEMQEYKIGNLLVTAEEISQRLVRNLEKHLDISQVAAVRIGLREMLINSIEHGNLGITYAEKTRELGHNRYREFLLERQETPEFRNRAVDITYQMFEDRAEYTITDQGEGFSHAKMRQAISDHIKKQRLTSHGRGIIMAENIFDSVTYNEQGNSVRLVKFFASEQLNRFKDS